MYFAYGYVGKEMGGKFPIYDFIKGNQGICIKTMDITSKSYANSPSQIRSKVNKYVKDMSREIENDKIKQVAEKILDIYILEEKKSNAILSALNIFSNSYYDGKVLVRFYEY